MRPPVPWGKEGAASMPLALQGSNGSQEGKERQWGEIKTVVSRSRVLWRGARCPKRKPRLKVRGNQSRDR